MPISQGYPISNLAVFKEIANRTGLLQSYTVKYYFTNVGNQVSISQWIPNFVWIRNGTLPSVTGYIWEWDFSVMQSPLNYVSIFQVTIFSNDDNVRIYINDKNTPTVTIPYNANRSGLAVWTWNNVYYARIELDNQGGSWCSIDMGVYYQFNQSV